MQYWHMQMHPNDINFAKENVYHILQHQKVIGLGNWDEGKAIIECFINDMSVNDVVAIKTGAKLIALVQVIGGAYQVFDSGWMENRRPIRVLDWELEEKDLPQPRGTLVRCVNDVPTTQIIKEWHERVIDSFSKRDIQTTV